MKTLTFLLLAGLLASSGFAQELNWPELARRPELWPAHCTLKEAIHFQGGVTVQAGQELTVLQVKSGEVDLTTADGRVNFAAEPDETDLLAVARSGYTALTPRQRALTYAAIAQQKALWPAEVVLQKSFDLGGGASVHAGDRVPVLEVLPDRLSVQLPQGLYQVAPYATDVMTQARQLVENPQAAPRFVDAQQKLAAQQRAQQEQQQAQQEQRLAEAGQKARVRVYGELEGRLINAVTDQPEPLDAAAPPRYLVFYRGSSTCPITNRVTPSLIQWYRQVKPTHPEFDIIWIMTESPEDTGRFARKLGFSWRAVTYDSTAYMPDVSHPITGLLPQLIVMDPSGRVLINAQQNAVPGAIRQLDALLKKNSEQL